MDTGRQGRSPAVAAAAAPDGSPRPRVAMDSRALIAGGWSLRRYTAELMRGLVEMDVDLQAWLAGWHVSALGARLAQELDSLGLAVPVRTVRAPGAVLYAARGPALWGPCARLPWPRLLPREVDLFHAIHWPFPLCSRPPAVLTIHDLIALRHPEWAPPGAVKLCRAIADLAPRAAQVIVDSAAVGEELRHFSRVRPERITIVPLGVRAEDFAPQASPTQVAEVNRRHGLHRPYFLAVGTIEPRKNLSAVIRAYDLFCQHGATDWVLQIIGGRVGPHPEFDQLLTRPRAGAVQITPAVSDSELAVLMQHARGFVFPSLAEGFGLPVLEAFAAGCPVITSDRPPMSDVAGEAALLVDPTAPAAIAAAMTRLAQEPELGPQLARRGRERAAQFTWERTARLTLEVYRKAREG